MFVMERHREQGWEIDFRTRHIRNGCVHGSAVHEERNVIYICCDGADFE